MTPQEWYTRNNCDHAHCPYECEHPQPFVHPDGRLLCGRCWFVENEETVMIPCTPGTCEAI